MTVVLLYTDIADLVKVKKLLKNVNDWQSLGLELGLLYPTLKRIKKEQHGDINDCIMEMLAAWLQQQDNVTDNGVPSWSILKTALVNIGENELADTITTWWWVLSVWWRDCVWRGVVIVYFTQDQDGTCGTVGISILQDCHRGPCSVKNVFSHLLHRKLRVPHWCFAVVYTVFCHLPFPTAILPLLWTTIIIIQENVICACAYYWVTWLFTLVFPLSHVDPQTPWPAFGRTSL